MRDAHHLGKINSPYFALRVSLTLRASGHYGAVLATKRLANASQQLRGPRAALYIGRYRGTMLHWGPDSRRIWLFPMPTSNTGLQSKTLMPDAPHDPPLQQGITQILLAQRSRILHFLRLRGAGDAAEDIYQELWMRLSHRAMDHIADPASYVMRAANNLMLDRYRSQRQREMRDIAWGELTATTEASAENRVIAHQQLQQINHVIDNVGARPAHVFRRFRLDAAQQKEIAAELGISLSTVEADLRKVYAAIAATRRQFDAPQ